MYCRTCGNQMNDNAEICVKCGVKKFVGTEYCQNCGAKTLEQAEICTECGVKLVKKSVGSLPTFNTGEIIKNKDVVKIARIIAMIILILGIFLIGKACVSFIVGFLMTLNFI